jgi:PEP-CTERM motif
LGYCSSQQQAPMADAAVVLNFGQVGLLNTVNGTTNGADTQTTITGGNVSINITQIIGGAPTSAILNLSATSTGPANLIQQAYSGTFSITSGQNGTGTNYLSGSFNDVVSGGGNALTLSASTVSPGESVSFTSGVIPPAFLGGTEALSLAFSNVTPAAHIIGSTLAPFSSSVAGNFSARVVLAAEPATLALFGVALFGLSLAYRRRG